MQLNAEAIKRAARLAGVVCGQVSALTGCRRSTSVYEHHTARDGYTPEQNAVHDFGLLVRELEECERMFHETRGRMAGACQAENKTTTT